MAVVDITRWRRASPYLDQVLVLAAHERDALLLSLWEGDPELAADVEAFLAEHRLASAEGFLGTPPSIRGPEPALEGIAVGAYTLLSPIGQGGMGSVWLAARSDGRFEGRAALKLLHAARVGRAAEARFRREGTILARLTHPHIARLIDAGVSGTGQPYLVLEHVDGRHIDRYCDEEQLGIDDRIRLILDVLSAVAHAHASLIVHRDLKPSNVLVTPDGTVKLLDFGIAKLLETDADAPAATLTHEGEIALTPKYAAPEQVTGGPITTATDVYALGVLLYELLSGQHPTGGNGGSAADFVRAVVETEPSRLSAGYGRVANTTEAAMLAARRSTTPERLRRLLRGDLERIVAKALKADPAERYKTVGEFAADLRRFLNHEPIAARPDTLGYRAAKFVRRHRRSLAASAGTATVLVSLVVFYTVRLSAERDRASLQAAKATKVSELLTDLLTGADPYRTPDAKEPTVQNLLDIGADRIANELGQEPEIQAEMLTLIGRTYERMGLHTKALPLLEHGLAVGRAALGPAHVTLAQSLNDLGVLYRERGDPTRAEPLLRESLVLRRQLLGPDDKAVAVTLVELARVLDDTGRPEEAEPYAREALAIRRKVFGEEHRETATSKSDLGRLLMRRGDLAAAEPLLRENVATTERLLGADHPNTAAAKSNLAVLLMTRGDAADAEALLREAVDVKQRVFGAEHPEVAQTLNSLALVVEVQGRTAEAQALFEESLRIARPHLGETHPRLLGYGINLARVRIARGEAASTEPSLRSILSARERLYPSGDWRTAQAQSLLGAALMAQGRYDEAEPFMLAAASVLKAIPGSEERERAANRSRLVALYKAWGRADEAEGFR